MYPLNRGNSLSTSSLPEHFIEYFAHNCNGKRFVCYLTTRSICFAQCCVTGSIHSSSEAPMSPYVPDIPTHQGCGYVLWRRAQSPVPDSMRQSGMSSSATQTGTQMVAAWFRMKWSNPQPPVPLFGSNAVLEIPDRHSCRAPPPLDTLGLPQSIVHLPSQPL